MSHRPGLSFDRQQIIELLSRDHDWQMVGRELSISPGLAYMVATGAPADGSGTRDPDARIPRAARLTAPQVLSNPSAFSPTRNENVLSWLATRARRELRRPGDDGGQQATAGEDSE